MRNKFSFSINSYDSEGDNYETGIYLHFNNVRIKVADHYDGFCSFVRTVEHMKSFVKEHWEDLVYEGKT